MCQVVERDLKKLGYVFQYSKLDTQNYLLLQRRNRVYGLGDLDDGQDPNLLKKKMAATLADMSSNQRFSFESVFDASLPKIVLRGNAEEKVRQALELSLLANHSQNIFVDTSTSAARKPEVGMGVLTCVRPSHPVYSVKLGRYITASEFLKCQGIWKEDFGNPSAMDALLDSPAKGQDLAGNAFSSTVAQAQLIASLVHGNGWKSISSHETMPVNHDQGQDPGPRHDSLESSPPSLTSLRSSSFDSSSHQEETTAKRRKIDDYWDRANGDKPSKFDQAPAPADLFEAWVCLTRGTCEHVTRHHVWI